LIADDCGDALEADIARLVSGRIVEHFEMVDVEQNDGKVFGTGRIVSFVIG
jgi:hypothetical protein